MLLAGKTALVTGGARGIGRAIVLAFANEGAHVALNDYPHLAEARQVAERTRDRKFQGQAVEVFPADVSSSAQVSKMVDSVLGRFGHIDILVCNAGIQTEAPFLELAEEDVDRVLSVNLKGPFLVSQCVARAMAKSGGGRIINISSVHEDIPRKGIAHYAASKGGLRMLTRVMALELAPFGINVNSIAPGAIETPMNEALLVDTERRNRVLAKVPLGRMGTAEEVGRVAVFLAGEGGAYITGSTCFIDGGLGLGGM